MRWLMPLIAALAAVSTPARADDISAAARGVVRVVIIAEADGEEIGRGHGSGFAIAPNRIVTNAHVVELARKFPSLVTIDVVPESGSDHYQGELVAFDPDADLAIIQFDGASLPPLTLYSPPLPDGADLVSLGYPGNVDKATYDTLGQMLNPTAPVRSTGILSAHRALRGVGTIEHTAQIARGNSGGPLLDTCGRVVGVNRAITTAEDGDASFVMSLDEDALVAFLKAQKQAFRSVDWPCTSMNAAMARENERASQQAEAQEADARDRQYQAIRARDEAIDRARQDNQDVRDNMMGGAALMLVLGALIVGASGMMLTRGNRRAAIWTASGGGVLMVGAAILFVLRPGFDPASVEQPEANAQQDKAPGILAGKLLCRLDPDRSRITVSQGADRTLDWDKDGCLAKNTQYVETANGWRSIRVADDDQTVSIETYDPLARTLVVDRYFPGRDSMARLRDLRPDEKLKACTNKTAQLAELASRQSAMRAALPAQPDEHLVYGCSPQ
ncbi:trypsin-like peptidase domain-containing protein [Stakelama sp. CBK3Z-3]|uniref:Trypsin-like peptidase domain-containing protein n=1 Tax=Stakelama flava TaxID=2860338 RepID=A0ABS6XMB3_9SPHN|nr:trypsin-like peptidase domain-containing protein [Stakelama flava]